MQATFMLAAATWEEVVPFIAMATVPLATVIGILWKKLTSTQDQVLTTTERIIPLASDMTSAVTEMVVLIQKMQERTPSKQQMDRFSRNMERAARGPKGSG